MIIWLASYPKSGNTWMRSFLISLMMKNKDGLKLKDLKNIRQFPTKKQYIDLGINIDFNNFDEVSKYWNIAQSKINSDKKIRFFKTHNAFCKIKENLFTNSKNTLGVIHIVRDPRNVITSIKYHYSRNNINDALKFIKNEKQLIGDLKNPLSEFDLPTVISSWKNHFNSWKKIKTNYLLIKYEKLLNKPEEEFSKITNFLEKISDFKFDKKSISKSITSSNFNLLKNQEKREGFNEAVKDEFGNPKKFFNLGPDNNWKKILDPTVTKDIESNFKHEMEELGYL